MSRPNLLFIMDDQHRHDYLGSAGAYFLQTPNLDRLAARGVRFTQCTVNAPLCAPSRIGLASGLQPGRLGCAFAPVAAGQGGVDAVDGDEVLQGGEDGVVAAGPTHIAAPRRRAAHIS